jgi:hypothetical protein
MRAVGKKQETPGKSTVNSQMLRRFGSIARKKASGNTGSFWCRNVLFRNRQCNLHHFE